MLDLAELINLKRQHIKRFANKNGAAGEAQFLANTARYAPRPKGARLAKLLAALRETGITVKGSSFDAIALPGAESVDFDDVESIKRTLPRMTFIEIKTANQARVTSDFSGFFFAFTEGEIAASEQLGERHKVLLVNKVTGTVMMTSVRQVLSRAKSLNWQVSVQL